MRSMRGASERERERMWSGMLPWTPPPLTTRGDKVPPCPLLSRVTQVAPRSGVVGSHRWPLCIPEVHAAPKAASARSHAAHGLLQQCSNTTMTGTGSGVPNNRDDSWRFALDLKLRLKHTLFPYKLNNVQTNNKKLTISTTTCFLRREVCQNT